MTNLLASAFEPITAVPAHFRTGSGTAWFFTVWGGGLAVAIAPWVIRRAVRDRDPVPLLIFLGGFITSLEEAGFDHACHLWWAPNLPGPAWIGFNERVPLLIPFCYAATIGMESYLASRYLRRGLSARGVGGMWLLICASDMLLEYPGVLLHAYRYYGTQPFDFGKFPWWFAWVNGTGVFAVATAIWFLEPRLRGRNRLALLAVPPVVFGAAWGGLAWPDLIALNWRLPEAVAWLISLLSLILCLLVVALIVPAAAAGAVQSRTRSTVHGPAPVESSLG